MSIAANLAAAEAAIRAAAARRRLPAQWWTGPVKLVAVTKNQDITAVRNAVDAGAAAIGENRVQEAKAKAGMLCRQVEWHLIGHLQTNKVRDAVRLFDLIHSVDSERLALELNAAAAAAGKRQDILLQVNMAGEDAKFGLEPSAAGPLAAAIAAMDHLRLCGLMTMAPFVADPEEARPVFRAMFDLFMELRSRPFAGENMAWLSMGMTNDFTVAVEEGANLVRIGTGIFGPRQ